MARRKTIPSSLDEPPAGLVRLWAPWRRTYVEAAGRLKLKCIFCFGRLSEVSRRERLIVYRGRLASVMLNRYPYNNGHLMVAPRRHVASPELLSPRERAVISELIAEAVTHLRAVYRPDGFNLGANLGRSAGAAGVADHMHWHVTPRWDGDTNYMPVVAGTRVVSELLEESFTRLSPLFKAVQLTIP
ncbi:MAG: HIT domain-containing protein [Candidatus Binataceae bacterium]|nr:HIT domain-containing protein [Candidatus Binataceae bacterium]